METENSESDLKLKEQFQQLQEQQQQRLLERRKKKAQENKTKKQNIDASGKFGVNDDLGLELAKPPEKGQSCAYVSEELVDHLNDQIRQMKDENGRLYKLVNEKDFEIRQLKKKGEESKKNSAIDGQVTNETAATKIIELSKKVRDLTSEKEAEKTKCKQFQKKCMDLQTQLQSLPAPSEISSVTGSMISLRSQIDNRDEDKVDVKALQDRLKQSESRLSDFRNQCQQLRQELKVANKVLSSELGENVNIQSLLNETSNWRGRAQQIIALQQKVDELKVQLESKSGDGDLNLGSSEKGGTARRRQDEKYREELRRIEKERKEAQENAVTKLKELEAERESLNNKLDAAKARNKILSSEIKTQKAQVQTLLTKSKNDDEFIDALMKQQRHLKTLVEEHNSQTAQQQMQQQIQLQQMTMKSQQDNNIVEQLKAIAAQKEAQVKMLEMELQQLRMGHSQAHQGVNMNQMSSQASTPQPLVFAGIDSRPPTASDTDTLTNRQRELTSSALGSARSSRPGSRALSAAGVNPSGAPAIGINEEELKELRYQIQELEVMKRTVEVERDKMTELVQVLQDRLSQETERLTEAQAELQGQKRLAVELEKRLGRLQASEGKRKGTAKGNVSVRETSENDADEDKDNGELLARLDIQKDENESLKVALQRTLQAKQEDLKIYSDTLEETKKVFLQALKQMKEKLNNS